MSRLASMRDNRHSDTMGLDRHAQQRVFVTSSRYKKIFNRREAKIIFTQLGYDNLLKAREKLLKERPEAVRNLREAREMGDLSENGYYKAARAKLSFLDSRLRNNQRLIKLAEVIKITNNGGMVEIGSRVVITNGKTKNEYTLVGSYESNPAHKTISHLSPIGRAIIGKKVKEKVEVLTPSGMVTFTILRIL